MYKLFMYKCYEGAEFWDTLAVWWSDNFCNYGMQFPLGIDLLPMKQINKSKYIRQYVHQFYSRIKATTVNTYAATQSMISCIIFHTFKNVQSVTTSKAIIPISFYDISCMYRKNFFWSLLHFLKMMQIKFFHMMARLILILKLVFLFQVCPSKILKYL